MITDQDIQNLIRAPKEIRERKSKKRYKMERGHRRRDLTLYLSPSEPQASSKKKSAVPSGRTGAFGQHVKFVIFIRQNQAFIENFSIGLRCEIPSLKSAVTLIRYNGPHGPIKSSASDHHSYPHIHRITQKEVQSGSFNPRSQDIELTNKYNTFEEGLRAFLIDMNVTNRQEYFPELEQRSLF